MIHSENQNRPPPELPYMLAMGMGITQALAPKAGDVWPEEDRKRWLQLLEGSFKLIRKDAAPALLEAAAKPPWADQK